ncbi:efflux RND transporter permease subunit [Croceibacterium mercuriale]|uniref:efflux RND transporter permease subunit n=1 Tax=Croceibacterium mercuriale TaxID=1572751 RepID=UPI0009DEC608|nr:efflux RND transporter permease subunit [Croceibacterium mercuriale]
MMAFLTRFVERPVLASVVSLVILLLGLQAITSLSTREYPEITQATININTPYTGADAELVRGFITTPLEQAISEAEGIDYLQSTSTQGQSSIQAFLELNYDPNDAVAQILTKINQVSNQLPPEAENSVVYVTSEAETDAMYIAFQSEALSPAEMTDYLNRAIRPQIETVDGIQQARIQGSTNLALRVWLDPRRMAALDVAPSDVQAALASNNYLSAVGETKGSTFTLPLTAGTDIDSVDAFRQLIVRQTGDALIRLEDIARVELGAEDYGSSTFISGKPAVFMEVEVAPDANLLTTISEVNELFPRIQADLPAGMTGTIVYDATVAVNANIDEVISALWQALLIVTVVILLFLGSWRSALVPVIAMPLSIVGAFFLMSLLGYSINLLTLLALILAIGTVVDDGVVIVENAMRHIEEGADPEEAAKRTVKELASSIVAMNVVVLAVFLPVGLIGGLTGSLFTEFAYTVAGATLMSGIVGLTLSPMMCAQVLRASSNEKKGVARWVDKGFRKTADGYARVLGKALDLRWFVIGFGVVVLASCWFLFSAAQSELAPPEDDGFLIIQASGDPNGSLDQLERWTAQLGKIVGSYDSVRLAFVTNGAESPDSAFAGAVMKDWADREQSQQELQPQLTEAVSQVAGLEATVIEPPTLPGGGGGPPIQFVIGSIEDPRAIFEQSEQILTAARASGLFQFIDSDLTFDRAQGNVAIDREKASALGVDIATLGQDLSTLLAGGYVNFFSLDERSYRVIPQVDRSFRLTPEQLDDYYVRANPSAAMGGTTGGATVAAPGGQSTAVAGAPAPNARATGQLVPLSAFATVDTEIRPNALSRFNQLNAAILSGVPAPGVSLGEAIGFLEEQAANLPQGYTVDYAGVSRQFTQEGSNIGLAFGLAVILVFLTLAAQYESFRDPAVMLVSVPMSLAGALLFFALGVVSSNIYTQIGLLALTGSIIRHGILLVEFANQIQEDEGVDRRQAMEKAAALRLRSILMTTIATLIGLVPLLVWSSGPGANSRFAISFVLGVGMAIGTLFTLFVVPALYTVVATKRGDEADKPKQDDAPEKQPATA